jgi:MFS family permease
MKKINKILLTAIIFVILYVGLYYLMVENASPEKYEDNTILFYIALIFGIIGIPVGAILFWVLQKTKMDKQKTDLVTMVFAVIWGLLFGWITLVGVMLGSTIVEKDGSKQQPQA